MVFSDRMRQLLDQGVVASKEFAAKAGAKAQDLGERGILMVEIKQLEGKAKKLLGQLGTEVYRLFAECNQDSIERDTPEIQATMTELSSLRETLEQKETELRNRRG